MLPTHGTVTSIFLLANSLRHAPRSDVADWVEAASARRSFLAAALDHRRAAAFLLDTTLVVQKESIIPSARLKALSGQADRPTLIAIARLLLELDPPPWLPQAVEGQVRYEFIPSADLQGLAWMRPELDAILLDSARKFHKPSGAVALGLGRAAELAVLASLEVIGATPLHVSEISDRFGYDIETIGGHARRWEVKGCTTNTSTRFHLSRNEFDKCERYGDEWRLVQVEFYPTVLTATLVTEAQISRIREVSAKDLIEIVPSATSMFDWETSALVTPSEGAWKASSLVVPTHFRAPSVVELAEAAVEMRDAALGREYG